MSAKSSTPRKSVYLARETIRSLEEMPFPFLRTTEKVALAKAHYTLALQAKTSRPKTGWHLNAAVRLLKTINSLTPEWSLQLARIYHDRAIYLENDGRTLAALQDYHAALDLVENIESLSMPSPLSEQEHLLYAQAAIAIADILLHTTKQDLPSHLAGLNPFIYTELAIRHLFKINQPTFSLAECQLTLAHAYHLKGIILNVAQFEEANQSFHAALNVALQLPSQNVSLLIEDIYFSLGLLWETKAKKEKYTKQDSYAEEYAFIYYTLSDLFSVPLGLYEENEDNPNKPDSEPEMEWLEAQEEFALGVKEAMSLIRHVLDPFAVPALPWIARDVMDALLYSYTAAYQKTFSNIRFTQELQNPYLHQFFLQHLICLMTELFDRSALLPPLLKQLNSSLLRPNALPLELNIVFAKQLNNLYHLPYES